MKAEELATLRVIAEQAEKDYAYQESKGGGVPELGNVTMRGIVLVRLLNHIDALQAQVPTDAEFLGLRSVIGDSDGPSENDSYQAASYLDRVEHLRKTERAKAKRSSEG